VEKARKLLRTFAQHTYLPLPIQNKTKIQKVAKILTIFSDERNETTCAMTQKGLRELNGISTIYDNHISDIFISLIQNTAEFWLLKKKNF
jgi:riboflavin synthase alpha subunit